MKLLYLFKAHPSTQKPLQTNQCNPLIASDSRDRDLVSDQQIALLNEYKRRLLEALRKAGMLRMEDLVMQVMDTDPFRVNQITNREQDLIALALHELTNDASATLLKDWVFLADPYPCNPPPSGGEYA